MDAISRSDMRNQNFWWKNFIIFCLELKNNIFTRWKKPIKDSLLDNELIKTWEKLIISNFNGAFHIVKVKNILIFIIGAVFIIYYVVCSDSSAKLTLFSIGLILKNWQLIKMESDNLGTL